MNHAKKLLGLGLILLLAACASPEERAADYLVKAQAFYDEGELVKAKLEAQNAAQVEPKNSRARYLLALIAEKDEKYQEMFGHLMVAVDGDPDNVEARIKLGTLFFLGQAWDEAEKQAAELLKMAPDDARVHLLQARVLVQKGDREAGIAEINKSLEIDPDYADAIILKAAADSMESIDAGLQTLDTAIARLPAEASRPLRELRVIMLSQAKRIDQVETSLQSLAADFPKEQSYQFQLAQFYTSQGRVDDAEQLLKGLTERDPTDTDKQLGYVQFLATQRDQDKAEAALREFIDQNPDANKLRLALGQLLESRERPEDAKLTYQALAERSPKSAEGLNARNRIVAIEIRAGKLDVAAELIDKILADAPDDPEALLYRAGLRFQEKKFDDAIADLRLVLRKQAESERALLLLGQAYAQKGDLTLAKDTYRRLLEVNPKSADGLHQLAVLHVMGREFREAEELLRRQIELKPDDGLASGRLIEVLMAQQKTDQAEAEARRLAGVSGEAGLGDFSLGRVLAQKKDYSGAAEAFRKAAAARKSDPLPLEGLVRSLVAAGKPNDAIAVLNEQLGNADNELFAKFLLGGIYGGQGDTGKAVAYLEDVVSKKPDSIVAWQSLAGAYRKDPDTRIKVYERGLKANPGSLELTMLLGSELEMAGRQEDSIRLYEAHLKGNPDAEPVINNLAALLLDHRSDKESWARALELARKLEKAQNPAVLDTLGWAYYRAGQYAEAISVLERVTAQAGQIPIFHYHLGMAYLASGNTVNARQELKRAVDEAQSDYPGIEEARQALKKL
ncbi:MAG: tetratricopeptide repeat protein [Gammaproteobacteria bacterium]|nr:tetratricopeptide repeat protein [Gammaproteobacteria bacterium]